MSRRSLPSLLIAAAVALPLHAQATRSVTILHLNDTHANVVAGAPRTPMLQPTTGGLARAATIVEKTRRQRQAVLTLHSGDFCMGDPTFNFFFGVPELQLLAGMGVDAMAVGNHEFDLTPMSLLGALVAASTSGPVVPLLSANLDFSDPQVQALQTFVQPYTIREVGGLRIGIFGMTTPTTSVLSLPAPVVVSSELGLIAAQTVGALQQAQCDVVVMLSHLGVEFDELIARNVPGIHLILGGHDHFEMVMPLQLTGPLGEPVTIVQTSGYYRQMGRMEVRWHQGHVDVRHYDLIDLDASVPEHAAFRAPVAALRQQVEQLVPGMYTSQVAYALRTYDEKVHDLTLPGRHDTAVGNFVADALLHAGGTDLAVEPCGSTAQPIHRGPVLPVDLFRTVGYGFNTTNGLGFRVCTFRIPGLGLLGGLEMTLASLPDDSDFLVQVSRGFAYRYDPDQPVGLRLQEATLHGTPLDPLAIYRVTANEFVLAFLRDYLQLPVFDVQVQNLTEFEAVVQYAAGRGVLVPWYPLPRVVAVD